MTAPSRPSLVLVHHVLLNQIGGAERYFSGFLEHPLPLGRVLSSSFIVLC